MNVCVVLLVLCVCRSLLHLPDFLVDKSRGFAFVEFLTARDAGRFVDVCVVSSIDFPFFILYVSLVDFLLFFASFPTLVLCLIPSNDWSCAK